MSQRYYGRPLARASGASLVRTVALLLAVPLGLLAARTIDATALDGLTPKAIVGALFIEAVPALGVAGWDGWQLWRGMRAAEPATAVTPLPDEEAPDEPGTLPGLIGSVVVVVAIVSGVSLAFGEGAAFCVAAVALGLGVTGGRFAARRLLARREQRLGRRYYKTVGEPAKVVWTGATGLE